MTKENKMYIYRGALIAIIILLLLCEKKVNASDFFLSQIRVIMNVGETIDLDVIGTEQKEKWSSYNENIATVTEQGVVKAVRKGKTTIAVRVGLMIRKCIVSVVDADIKLNKKSASIYSGGTSTNTIQLKAMVKGAQKAVAWKSSDESVAIVDANGKVTSVAPGIVIITAMANGKEDNCVITVKESSIILDTDSLQLGVKGQGSSIKLKTFVTGSSNKIKWTTSNKKVAVVSDGKVTGKSSGTAIITATANGISTNCTVTVIKDSVALNLEKETLYVGESKTLKTNAGKNETVYWSSSDEKVVTVENGKVTATGVGTAVVSAEKQGTVDSCVFLVKDIVTNIQKERIELHTKGVNKSYQLEYEVIGRKTEVKWTTSDANIATVKKGKITAKKAGNATITATANGVSDTVEVEVMDYIPTIQLNRNEYVLYTGKGNVLNLKVAVDGVNKKVVWESTDEAVATVNEHGKVTALKEGITQIKATANGVSDTCLIRVRESKVILESKNFILEIGEKAELPADVIGKSQTLKYTSSNGKVAVIKNGVITAKKCGEADIRVTANGITEICQVQVIEEKTCSHQFDEGTVVTEPDCNQEGIRKYTCILCGESYTVLIEKTEHTWYLSETIPGTCNEPGTEIYLCENCPESKTELADYENHICGEWETVTEASHYEEGLKKKECINCDYMEYEIIPKIAHNHVEYTEEATCIEGGVIYKLCECGDYIYVRSIDPLGHLWGDWVTEQLPVDGENGWKKRKCQRCPQEETEIILHEHLYNETIVDPTCTSRGYTEFRCECGDYYYDDYTEVLEHDYRETGRIPATCESEGKVQYQCIGCPDYYEETIPMLEHSWDEGELQLGKGKYTCGWFYRFPTGEKQMTDCDLRIRQCTVCELEDWVYEKSRGHDYQTVEKSPTCATQGYREEICSRCDNAINRITLPMTPHTFTKESLRVTGDSMNSRLHLQFLCTRCEEPVYGMYLGVQREFSSGKVPDSKENCAQSYVENGTDIYLQPDVGMEVYSDVKSSTLPQLMFVLKNSNQEEDGTITDGICTLQEEGTSEDISIITGINYGNSVLEIYRDTGELLHSLQIHSNYRMVDAARLYKDAIERCDQEKIYEITDVLLHSYVMEDIEVMETAATLLANTVNSSMTEESMGITENMSEYEKINAVYRWLVNFVGSRTGANYVTEGQSVYSALIEKRSVCAGYAKSFQFFMDILNIPSVYITGKAYAALIDDHAWNMVYVKLSDSMEDEKHWYYVDATWSEFDKQNTVEEHIINNMNSDPECSKYYWRSLTGGSYRIGHNWYRLGNAGYTKSGFGYWHMPISHPVTGE